MHIDGDDRKANQLTHSAISGKILYIPFIPVNYHHIP